MMSKKIWHMISFYTVATSVAVVMLFPFFWMISTSLKNKGALIAFPIQWIPDVISFEGYIKVFTVFPFSQAIVNSILVASITTLVRLLSAAMAAYVFAKIEFKGREILFVFFLISMMIPQQVTFIPLFLVLIRIDLINTFTGLIAPSIFNAFAIFILRQHMKTINNAFIDAAIIDGASQLKIFVHIILPLSKPILATVGVIAFMESWNDYLWPLIVLTDVEKMTLPLALSKLSGQYSTDYHTLMAGSLISLIPILIIYTFGQKYFQSGLQLGGVK